MANHLLWAQGISGGGPSSLDGIDPLDVVGDTTNVLLEAGDVCLVMDDGVAYFYDAMESAGAVESLPDIVIPDANPGNFWWRLRQAYAIPGMDAVPQYVYELSPGGL